MPVCGLEVLAALVVKTSQEVSHMPVEVWYRCTKDISKSKVWGLFHHTVSSLLRFLAKGERSSLGRVRLVLLGSL